MDYEKKYKEALGWMQSVYPTMTGADKEDAEHYFPELKSEDERIREAIIDEFKGEFDAICDHITPEYDETDEADKRRMQSLREYLVWLEKQGEHKVEPTNITDQLKEEYQKGWDAAMQQLPQEVDNQVWQIANNAAITWEHSFAVLTAAKNAYEKGKADGITLVKEIFTEDILYRFVRNSVAYDGEIDDKSELREYFLCLLNEEIEQKTINKK